MAIKFKLSDEEKKKINKIATAMEEEKQTTRDTSSSQELPTASSKMKRKEQSIQNDYTEARNSHLKIAIE